MTIPERIQKFFLLLKISYHVDFNRPFDFFMRYLSVYLLCLSYLLFSKVVSGGEIQFDGQTMSLPLFLISGIAMTRFITAPIVMFYKGICELTLAGMMEWVQITSTGIWEILFARALWVFFLAFTEFICYIIFASFFIPISVNSFLNLLFPVSLILVFLAYGGIGMMILAIVLTFRKGVALILLIMRLSFALGGVFFPVSFLPEPFQILSNALPLTHALQIIRLSGTASSPSALIEPYVILIVLTIVYGVGGFVLAHQSLYYARKNGHFQRQFMI